MRVHKRTEVTVETDRVLIIRRYRSVRVWCQECGREADMVDIGEARVFTGTLGRGLHDGADKRGWHVNEGQDGIGLVCLESLLKSM